MSDAAQGAGAPDRPIARDEKITQNVAEGADSLAVRLCYREQHREGGGWEPWTEVEAPVPDLPVSLHLRPQTAPETRALRQGRAQDLFLGDAAFDSAYVVEGAPADVLWAWLDGEARQRILDVGPVWLKLSGGKLALHRDGWQRELEVPLCELVGKLALRLPAAAKAAYVVKYGGSRGDPDGALSQRRKQQWRDELLALAETLERRQSARRWRVVLIIAASLLGFVLLSWLLAFLQF